jgi:addiction module HigA family antidote
MSKLPIHPGVHIKHELEDIGMSANQLAKDLDIPQNRLSEIIRGRRGISADTALRLAAWLGTTPQFWMNLQRNYELDLVEESKGEEIRKRVKRYSAAA